MGPQGGGFAGGARPPQPLPRPAPPRLHRVPRLELALELPAELSHADLGVRGTGYARGGGASVAQLPAAVPTTHACRRQADGAAPGCGLQAGSAPPRAPPPRGGPLARLQRVEGSEVVDGVVLDHARAAGGTRGRGRGRGGAGEDGRGGFMGRGLGRGAAQSDTRHPRRRSASRGPAPRRSAPATLKP